MTEKKQYRCANPNCGNLFETVTGRPGRKQIYCSKVCTDAMWWVRHPLNKRKFQMEEFRHIRLTLEKKKEIKPDALICSIYPAWLSGLQEATCR